MKAKRKKKEKKEKNEERILKLSAGYGKIFKALSEQVKWENNVHSMVLFVSSREGYMNSYLDL